MAALATLARDQSAREPGFRLEPRTVDRVWPEVQRTVLYPAPGRLVGDPAQVADRFSFHAMDLLLSDVSAGG